MSKIDVLCHQLGIRIVPYRRRRQYRETHARQVLTKLRARLGDGHLIFVLRTIVQSKNNAPELWSETILAVSDIVRLRPDLADKGLAFLEAFDRIPLGEVRAHARRLNMGAKRAVMRVMITERLEAELNTEPQRRLL